MFIKCLYPIKTITIFRITIRKTHLHFGENDGKLKTWENAMVLLFNTFTGMYVIGKSKNGGISFS